MTEHELVFTREYDLSAPIVWDALVDDVLVEGWLAPSSIEPRLGGRYRLDWSSGGSLAPTNGVIALIDAPRRLTVQTDNIGTLDFTLASVASEARSASTVVTLRLLVQTHPRFHSSTIAYWRSNFDQLGELLRGRPVDWSTWQHDRGDIWTAYLRAASGGS